MQSYKCAADLLIVMDATSSTQSYINQFKQHALSMYDEIILALKEKARIIEEKSMGKNSNIPFFSDIIEFLRKAMWHPNKSIFHFL